MPSMANEAPPPPNTTGFTNDDPAPTNDDRAPPTRKCDVERVPTRMMTPRPRTTMPTPDDDDDSPNDDDDPSSKDNTDRDDPLPTNSE